MCTDIHTGTGGWEPEVASESPRAREPRAREPAGSETMILIFFADGLVIFGLNGLRAPAGLPRGLRRARTGSDGLKRAPTGLFCLIFWLEYHMQIRQNVFERP